MEKHHSLITVLTNCMTIEWELLISIDKFLSNFHRLTFPFEIRLVLTVFNIVTLRQISNETSDKKLYIKILGYFFSGSWRKIKLPRFAKSRLTLHRGAVLLIP